MMANGWRDLEDLLPDILPNAIQCTEGLALEHLRKAVIRACERARLWVVDDDFEIGCDTDNLVIAPKGAQLYQIDRVNVEGSELEPITSQDMHAYLGRCNNGGNARFYAQADGQSLSIYPVQPGARARVRAYLIPTRDTNRAPKVVLDRHQEMLVHGALGRLLAVAGQPFTNVELANYHDMLFERRLDEINREYVTGAQRAPLRVRARFM